MARHPAIADLVRLILENQPCVVLTGAGVSTETCRKPPCVPYGELRDRFERKHALAQAVRALRHGTEGRAEPLRTPFVAIASRDSDAEEIIQAYGPIIRGARTVAERSR
jgi:hypothetical protein